MKFGTTQYDLKGRVKINNTNTHKKIVFLCVFEYLICICICLIVFPNSNFLVSVFERTVCGGPFKESVLIFEKLFLQKVSMQ